VLAAWMAALACLSIAAWLATRHVVWEVRPVAGVFRPDATAITSADWNCWRGQLRDGVAPIAADDSECRPKLLLKKVWKCPIVGQGHSSPIVCAGLVVVTSAQSSPDRQLISCHSLANGALQWSSVLSERPLPPKHAANSAATSTPCCDGKHLYAVVPNVDSLELVTVRLTDGTVVRRTRIGPLVTRIGYSASPALAGNLIVVACESRGGRGWRYVPTSYLVAVDRHTGRLVWRVRRPIHDGFASPVVMPDGQTPVVLQAGAGSLAAYRLADGVEAWRLPWGFTQVIATPVITNGRILVTGTEPDRRTLLVAPPAGDGDQPEIIWESRRFAARVPSPLVYERHGIVLDDTGVAAVFDLEKATLQRRCRVSAGRVTASPVLIGDEVLTTSVDGTLVTWSPHATKGALPDRAFSFDEDCFASPAISGAFVVIRTASHLWALQSSPSGCPEND